MGTRLLRRPIHWSVLVLAVIVIVSGLVITESRFIEAATFGLLHKVTGFKLHPALWIPFTLLMIAHVVLAAWPLKDRSSQAARDDRQV